MLGGSGKLNVVKIGSFWAAFDQVKDQLDISKETSSIADLYEASPEAAVVGAALTGLNVQIRMEKQLFWKQQK